MNGLTLPAPPEGYWATVPWWGYFAFTMVIVSIVVVIAPWMIQRARHSTSAMVSRERILADGLARLQLDQRAELERVALDRDRGWNLTRGWAAIAHPLWHDFNNLAHRYNELLALAHRAADCRLSPEGLAERLGGFKPIKRPEKLPDLEAAPPKMPGETSYG